MEPLRDTVLPVTVNPLNTGNRRDMERLPTVHRADIVKGA
jgi:hypothetical protein